MFDNALDLIIEQFCIRFQVIFHLKWIMPSNFDVIDRFRWAIAVAADGSMLKHYINLRFLSYISTVIDINIRNRMRVFEDIFCITLIIVSLIFNIIM